MPGTLLPWEVAVGTTELSSVKQESGVKSQDGPACVRELCPHCQASPATAALRGCQGMVPCATSLTCSARLSPEHPCVVILLCSGDLEPLLRSCPSPGLLIPKLAGISAQGMFSSCGLIGRVTEEDLSGKY